MLVFRLHAGRCLPSVPGADPDLVFELERRVAEADALLPSLRRLVARHVKELRETEPAQRRFRGRAWWNSGGAGGGRLTTVKQGLSYGC